MRLRGIGASPGIAVGKALVLETRDASIIRVPIESEYVEDEIQRFLAARETARAQIRSIRNTVAGNLGESYAQVFDAQMLILDDKALTGECLDRIRTEKVNAEWALKTVVSRFLRFFSEMEDPYIKERGGDVEDVHLRLQTALAGGRAHHDLSELTEDTVILAHTLSPSDAAALHHPHVIGMATDVGGRTSHTAIIAQALGIPAVVGLHDATARVRSGDTLVVDGTEGALEISPAPETLVESTRRRAELVEKESARLAERDLPAVTADGVPIALMANIEFPEELSLALRCGARGVGLYRSEFLYLMRSPDLPSEEEHYNAYVEIARGAGGEETVIRTLDLGGEKYFHTVLDREGANPVLGLRAIRFCLKRTDIFRTQLRGLLRASVEKNIRIMLPLVSGLNEVRAAKRVMEEVRRDLSTQGIPFNEDLDLGIMIEVPSAAVIADLLAREVSFFSIGTNDLIQYSLAVDRGNESVAYLYQPLHPAILRMLARVVAAAEESGIDVSLCGEMASDPLAVPVLIGLGIRKLSMTGTAIPAVKATVRRIGASESKELVRSLLTLPTAEDVEEVLRGWILERAPEAIAERPSRSIPEPPQQALPEQGSRA